jgi:hypothetical protein
MYAIVNDIFQEIAPAFSRPGLEPECSDSELIIVVQFYLVPSSTGGWPAYGATFGKIPSKSETIFGY